MNVTIQIHYISNETKILQGGSFPLRGRKPEQVAMLFWKHIKRENIFAKVLEKVTCNEEDITDLVKELEKQEYEKVLNDDLPF